MENYRLRNLETERLLIDSLCLSDSEKFFESKSDPAVSLPYFSQPLTREASDRQMAGGS